MRDDDDEPVASADQDAWIEIVSTVRGELAKRVPSMKDMNPSDMKIFVELLGEAIWLNQQALSFDKRLQDTMARLPYGD